MHPGGNGAMLVFEVLFARGDDNTLHRQPISVQAFDSDAVEERLSTGANDLIVYANPQGEADYPDATSDTGETMTMSGSQLNELGIDTISGFGDFADILAASSNEVGADRDFASAWSSLCAPSPFHFMSPRVVRSGFLPQPSEVDPNEAILADSLQANQPGVDMPIRAPADLEGESAYGFDFKRLREPGSDVMVHPMGGTKSGERVDEEDIAALVDFLPVEGLPERAKFQRINTEFNSGWDPFSKFYVGTTGEHGVEAYHLQRPLGSKVRAYQSPKGGEKGKERGREREIER